MMGVTKTLYLNRDKSHKFSKHTTWRTQIILQTPLGSVTLHLYTTKESYKNPNFEEKKKRKTALQQAQKSHTDKHVHFRWHGGLFVGAPSVVGLSFVGHERKSPQPLTEKPPRPATETIQPSILMLSFSNICFEKDARVLFLWRMGKCARMPERQTFGHATFPPMLGSTRTSQKKKCSAWTRTGCDGNDNMNKLWK